jgi:hypothetical protein
VPRQSIRIPDSENAKTLGRTMLPVGYHEELAAGRCCNRQAAWHFCRNLE